MQLDIMQLSDIVRQTSYEIHVYHGHGHVEKVYENALSHRLRKAGIDVKQQVPLIVRDEDGTVIGEFVADLLVDSRLVVELKAVRTIADEHVAQVLGYMRASNQEHGLLINFGSAKFQIRKFILSEFRNPPKSRLLPQAFAFLSSLFAFSAPFRG